MTNEPCGHSDVCCECGTCSCFDDYTTVQNVYQCDLLPESVPPEAVRWHTNGDMICNRCVGRILKSIESGESCAVLDDELSGESYTIEKWSD